MNTPLQVAFADPTTLPVGNKLVQICPRLGVGQSVLVYNNDLTNIAYVGYRTSGLTTSNTVPVQPLASATLDASRVMYAFCPTATVNLTVAPLGTNIQPSPAQIAQQINALGLATLAAQTTQIGQISSNPATTISQDIATNGTPLLHGADNIYTTSFSVPAATTATTGFKAFKKPGYFIHVTSQIANTATIPYLGLKMSWYDSTQTYQVGFEEWLIPSSVSGTYIIVGKGPSKGAFLNIQYTNYDPLLAATFTINVEETTQHIDRDDWRVIGIDTVPTLTTPTNATEPSINNIAGFVNGSIPASTVVNYLLPLYAGAVQWQFSSSQNMTIQLTTPTTLPAPYGGHNVFIQAGISAFNLLAVHPRIPTQLIVNNTAASTTTYSLTGTALEYAS